MLFANYILVVWGFLVRDNSQHSYNYHIFIWQVDTTCYMMFHQMIIKFLTVIVWQYWRTLTTSHSKGKVEKVSVYLLEMFSLLKKLPIYTICFTIVIFYLFCNPSKDCWRLLYCWHLQANIWYVLTLCTSFQIRKSHFAHIYHNPAIIHLNFIRPLPMLKHSLLFESM